LKSQLQHQSHKQLRQIGYESLSLHTAVGHSTWNVTS